MSPGDFHEKPFDEGTLTKLLVFQLYTREWLPVFLAKPEPIRTEIHVFDFFAGPGTDSQGVLGSPLLLLRELRSAKSFPGFRRVTIHAHFYDLDPTKIDLLKQRIADQGPIEGVALDVRPMSFRDALKANERVFSNKSAAKLLLVDQFGVGQVSDQVFLDFVSYPVTDFLFFLSSSTLHRFRDHPAIKQKITRPDDYYQVHRAALDYYRALLPTGSKHYLAPFSIRKEANIYGIIFGSAHPLGMDKFLQVAWKKDEISGEADFDIHRDNISAEQPKFDLDDFKPTKVSAFQRELKQLILSNELRTERDVMELCFRHGVLRQHSKSVLKELKDDGLIELKFRVPSVDRFREPWPIKRTSKG